MPHLGHDFPERLFKLITNAVSMFLLIVVFYILQYIFDMDFVCSCTPGVHINGVLYLTIPPVILTWIVNVTERFHQTRIFSIWRSLSHNNSYYYIVKLLITYLSLNAVWIASVLFDGDWYLCLMTNLNVNETGIPCKKDLTYEEYRIQATHKTESLDIGFYVICSLIIVWSAVESATAYCIRKKTWKRGAVSGLELWHPPYYRVVYEDLLAEQVSSHLKNELTKIATERAETICKPYLQAIGDHEQPFNNTRDGSDNVNNTVLEAWRKISASDFPFM